MCWSWFEKPILKTEIIDETEGLDEDEKLTNLAVGDMMGGFEGMVYADMYNSDYSATTTFLITYKVLQLLRKLKMELAFIGNI